MEIDNIKYKIMLIGEAEDIIGKFFSDGGNLFEYCTSSLNAVDLGNNLKYFQPNVVVYCMKAEHWEDMRRVSEVVEIPLVIIASQADYNSYVAFTEKRAEVFLQNSDPFDVTLEALSAFISGLICGSDTSSNQVEHTVIRDSAEPKDSEEWDGRKRIMVVDDSPVMQRTIMSMLKADYNVMTAISGKAALRYLESKTVDLILLDYEMSDENGPAVLEKLRANPATANIPVVFLTGVNDSNKIREVLSLKPSGYLLKPVEKIVLMDKIQEVLRFAPY